MAHLPQERIDKLNAMLALDDGDLYVPGEVLHAWAQLWHGGCVDPTCVQDHHFDIYLGISDDSVTDALPRGKIAATCDGATVDVPLDKNRICELIADLQEMLDAMP